MGYAMSICYMPDKMPSGYSVLGDLLWVQFGRISSSPTAASLNWRKRGVWTNKWISSKSKSGPWDHPWGLLPYICDYMMGLVMTREKGRRRRCRCHHCRMVAHTFSHLNARIECHGVENKLTGRTHFTIPLGVILFQFYVDWYDCQSNKVCL